MNHKRIWIVISYFTGVDGMAPSHHIDDRLQMLREAGIEPIVITSKASPPDNNPLRIRTPSPAPSGLRYELRHKFRRMSKNQGRVLSKLSLACLLPFYILECGTVGLGSTWSWYFTAARAAAKAAIWHDAELIYATGGPFSAFIAGLMCASRTRIPLIVEFQDPIAGDWLKPKGNVLRFQKKLEQHVADRADGVVYMTRLALEAGKHRTGLGDKGHFIYPGANPQMFDGVSPKPADPERLVLGHFGSLAETRSLEPLLKAFSKLTLKYSDLEQKVILKLAGHLDTAQKALIEQYRNTVQIEMLGKLSRKDALHSMVNCHGLLLIQDRLGNATQTIPSKTYEYLHSNVPVIGLTYQNPELESILRSQGHFAEDIRNDEAIVQMLDEIYTGWKTDGRICADIQKSPFTTERAADQLITIASDILAGKSSDLLRHNRRETRQEFSGSYREEQI